MPLRIASFDIESTGLNASFGRLLCACFKFQGDPKIVTVKAFQKKDELAALKKIRQIWDTVDILVTWYGKQFDVRFLNAKALRYGLPTFAGKMHVDLCFLHKHYNATAGHSLKGVSEDLRTSSKKYDVPREDWQDAQDGDKAAFDRIVTHCEHDVLTLEEVLDKMKGQITCISR